MITSLIIAWLAVYRVTRFIVYENGPFDLGIHIRSIASRSKFLSDVVSCPHCLSVYLAIGCIIPIMCGAELVLFPFAVAGSVTLTFEIVQLRSSG